MSITPSLFLDLILVSLLIYVLLVWFKRSRSGMVLFGLGIAATVYLLARQFQLILTTTILQWFFTAIIIIVVVIFQEEIKSFFERMAIFSIGKGFGQKRSSGTAYLKNADSNNFSKNIFELAQQRTGALITIKGKDPIDRHIQGGISLNGIISDAIINSIFDPNSSGHDGAVVIDRGVITKFGCHLPLTKNLEKLAKGGTRHSAALGMSEVSDTLNIVVSEERGTVSVTYRGVITVCKTSEQLDQMIEKFYGEFLPKRKTNVWIHWLVFNFWEKIIAISATLILWFVIIHGSEVIYKSYDVQVQVQNLSENLTIKDFEPKELEIAFSGARRLFYRIEPDNINLALDASQWTKNTKSVRIIDSDVTFPTGMVLRSVGPTRDLTILLEQKKK